MGEVEKRAEKSTRVRVLAPVPLASSLTYGWSVDDGEVDDLEVGQLVRVPLAGRSMVGMVESTDPDDWDIPSNKLKFVEAVIDRPPLPEQLRKFIDWVAAYTLAPRGALLKMCVGAQGLFGDPPTQAFVRRSATGDAPVKITNARERVLDIMSEGQAMTATSLAKKAGVSTGVVTALIKAGVLEGFSAPKEQRYPAPKLDARGPALSAEQKIAVDEVCKAIDARRFKPFLLDGVTGSGKTEVYFEAMLAALAEPGAQILVLVPEIALTNQWLRRFEMRFGVPPVVWHSDVGASERRRAWHMIITGNARVIVGARSALFLPFKNLRLLVVDEEHDPSFKQEEGVLYHARDMAIVRAKLADCPVVLASATPSLETLINADRGRYETLRLRQRFGNARLPDIIALDMRKAPPAAGKWVSPVLMEQVGARVAAGEQTMLFLNRRGYAPLTLCRSCGHRFGCHDCSSWLVEHRFKRELMCHQCGYAEPMPAVCPACKEKDTLVPCGPGVERVFDEISSQFPAARIAVMTSDTMTSPKATAQLIAHIEEGQLDIIIGTQIVTKGYHFPDLTLVGVIDADLGLRGGDLRAAERTYQQLMQVAGRAGRAEKPGEVYLQTYEPEHPVVQAMVRYDGATLMALERDAREQYQMPPFGRLAALILSGRDAARVAAVGRQLAMRAPHHQVLSIMGPTPAPFAKLRGDYRYRMLVHASRDTNIQQILSAWLAAVPQSRGVKIKVDIDPQSFL